MSQSAQTYPPLLPLEGTIGIDTGYFAWPFEESLRTGGENTNQTRTIKKAIPTKSLFTFFSPPTPPGEDDDLPDNEQDKIEQHHKLKRRLMG
ncbi:hypothetical protein CROQUDRAFT_96788 [Cronartium quercuum f. sp. fusiforme G11]|uniref:Uncharacterized protein n=1 Tax=Cronartium quercuum f. sp. fusiforme G11 TaxID=708437 RepID=A0A9P6T8X7_9BASI|nr:hypothetical protein CROQUDRAFT_96788 [Cronartium quercuum f. sp. fusiforme G11]